MDSPKGQLQTAGLHMLEADPSIEKTPSSIRDAKEVVAMLKSGKAAGVCNISAEQLKAWGEATYYVLQIAERCG